MRSLFISILLAAFAPQVAIADTKVRAGFKNATLGMSLSEWRALPTPSEVDPKLKPVCLGDERAPTIDWRTNDEKLARVLLCGYADTSSARSRWTGGRIGGEEYFGTQYLFLDDKLYEFRTFALVNTANEIERLLTAKYGAPSKIPATTRTGLGISVDVRALAWKLGSDLIYLQSPAEVLDRMLLKMTDSQAAGKVGAAGQATLPDKDRL